MASHKDTAQEKPMLTKKKTSKKYTTAKKLTTKQIKFARKYVETGNASEAYRRVYKTKGTQKTIQPESSRILNHNPMVAALVDDLKNKLVINVDTQVEKLERIHDLAVADKQYNPAINAINSQSKHLGLISDKPQVNISLSRAEEALVDVSPERIEAMLGILEGDYELID